jgi:HPt (histidine-containing phosphotransfer) domain-containing protein
MTDTHPHLNMDALVELKQVMGEEFALLISTFESDSAVRIESIREAVVAEDPDAIRRAAHSFKGSASNMGAIALTEHCRRLEEKGRNGELKGCAELLEQIIAEYRQVQVALGDL